MIAFIPHRSNFSAIIKKQNSQADFISIRDSSKTKSLS